ncbi:MAG TPA: ABC-type transport auxiliary lipoprotein family protein, partial [Burkholderiales bacterium]|nr:ABC-type transport auxiliary lipoprotein family protein [Burkholderiales bacterium]
MAMGLAGCGTSPPERFYTLASEPAPTLSANTLANAVSIIVGPVSVPELVDRPQFVVRSGANRVEIAEQSRWAAPLKHEIPRVIADHLARFIEGARTTTSASRAVA